MYWLNWFHFHILKGGLFIILKDCIISLSPFIDVTKMAMLSVSFIAQLNSETLLIECFLLTDDLSGFNSGINRDLLTVGSF